MHLSDFWAKTHPLTDSPALSVKSHCHLVGYVAQTLLNHVPESVRSMLPDGCVTLVACHDIGKICPGFQLKCPQWEFYNIIKNQIYHNGLETNHSIVSQAHIQYSEAHRLSRLSNLWCISTAGHHGTYPNGFNRLDSDTAMNDGGSKLFAPFREELLTHLVNSFGPLPTESAKNELERVHLLTGFTIFADWIGSNTDWFPFDTDVDPATVQEITRGVLQQLGYLTKPRLSLSFSDLFQSPQEGPRLEPRGIQSALLATADTPGLYIVEAPMGMGKTEAALAAAYKRWTEGPERGIYFALPTQLTSERIHERIHSFLTNAIESYSTQSLIHGNAWLNESRNRLLAAKDDDVDRNDTDEALRWFSSTRRQLLAPFGTGTIDQALLAVLPAKFAALRYLALAGKVVVIDEVHSYDPYMSALIDRLIRYLLKSGSTVIILSATLTAKRRSELVEAAGAKEETTPSSYPLITKVSTGFNIAEHISLPATVPAKQVNLIHHHLTQESSNAYWQKIADQIVAGANVVVIRNSVALAQETYRLLKSFISETIPNDCSGLLHSRFPQFLRNENETKWVTKLGKEESQRPSGSFLVSTQIVEQSVDIDSDLLITDLAPTDLILQRIGRLHRHERTTPRPGGCETPTCHILHPCKDWMQDAKVVAKALAPHHHIYPPFKLWQASEYLQNKNLMMLPDEIRTIIEESAALAPPNASSDALDDFLRSAQKEYAEQVRTATTRDIFSQSALKDREGAETRYNIKPTVHLILLKSRPTEISGTFVIDPLYGPSLALHKNFFSFELAKALQLNAIRIPAYLVGSSLKSQPEWLKNHVDNAVIGILHGRDVELLTNEKINFSLEYTSEIGLMYQKVMTQPFQPEPEDFWY
jgi:CRISPR-associated endonuclease/helicase Cas3